jgi:hypothetical protein
VIAQFNPELIAKPKLEPLPGDDKPDDAAAGKGDDEAKKPEAKGKDDDKTAEKKSDAEKTADEQAAEEDAAERKKAEAEKRTAIEKENKRKEDEYEEKLKKGKEHVKELNIRFADWYYIISDDTYHKIHLNRGDVVKDKEKKDAPGDTPDAGLKELEKNGFRSK